jgi:hypothetical protein
MTEEKSNKKGCLGLSIKSWFWLIIISIFLTIINKSCFDGQLFEEAPFKDYYFSGNHAEVSYEVASFKTNGEVSEYGFFDLVDRLWNFRQSLYKHGIYELEIILTAECIDKMGNTTLREVGRHTLNRDDLDYLYKCKEKYVYDHFSHMEKLLRLSFTNKCNGKIHVSRNI